MYLRRWKYGTQKQKAAFAARTLTLVGGFANMMAVSGVDLYSWISPLSLMYGGGPMLDSAVELKAFVDGPNDRRLPALNRFRKTIARLSFPGQVAIKDYTESLDQTDPSHVMLRALVGRPLKSSLSTDYLYNQDAYPTWTVPERYREMGDPLARSPLAPPLETQPPPPDQISR
jgi:hypothetical protein